METLEQFFKYNTLVNYLKILVKENQTFIDKEKIVLILQAMNEEVE